VAADTYGSDCCILVAWEDAVTRRLHGQRLKADASLHGSQMVLASPSSGRAVNPSLVYQRARDHFLLAYEAKTEASGTYVAARRVPAYSGAAGAELHLAAKTHIDRRDAHPEGRPRGAYNAGRDTYLVAWFDEPWVRGVFINGDTLSRTPAFRIPRPWSCSPFSPDPCLFQPWAVSTPAVVAVGHGFQVMFSDMSLWAGADSSLVSYSVVPGPGGSASISGRVLVDYSEGAKRATSAAYSAAADRVLVTWQWETGGYDIFGLVFDP
jgi:hypothetical protein